MASRSAGRRRSAKEPVIHVTWMTACEHTEGDLVFLPQAATAVTSTVRVDSQRNQSRTRFGKAMFAAFTAADLIEPVKVEIKSIRRQYDLLGLHTSNRRNGPTWT